MAEESTENIETIAYVVHGPKQGFTLEDIILTGMQDNELLIDMKYSGICHTVSSRNLKYVGFQIVNAKNVTTRICYINKG